MDILIHPNYFPNIHQFTQIIKANNILFEVSDNYQKQTFRNRTEIYGPNGKLNLIIPIVHRKDLDHQLDKNVLIHQENSWQKNHWRSLEASYRSSPFFEFYQDDLKPIFFKKHEKLVDYNMSLLILILEWLEIETKITIRSKQDAYNQFSNALVSSKAKLPLNFPKYIQVFEAKLGFHPNLNALDLLSNLGPESSVYLRDIDLNPMLELS